LPLLQSQATSLPRVAVSSEAPPREEEALLSLPFSSGNFPSTMRINKLLKSACSMILELKRALEPDASRLTRQEPVDRKACEDA
jgi:hypothetical protein